MDKRLKNISYKDLIKEEEKHFKGYGYDSLCLRYKIAREAQMRADMKNKPYDAEHIEKLAIKDMVKFFQILDDLIGEHD